MWIGRLEDCRINPALMHAFFESLIKLQRGNCTNRPRIEKIILSRISGSNSECRFAYWVVTASNSLAFSLILKLLHQDKQMGHCLLSIVLELIKVQQIGFDTASVKIYVWYLSY